ncbi:MAG TPA: DUF924 family protein [Caulobacterales bacterium]|nr:DUF924 family protein [Caulobacterales bacterium]
MTPADVIGFWVEAGRPRWFGRDSDFDEEVQEKFEPTHHAAARGELDYWEGSADGALALLLLLDQFPRNMFRGSAHAYATDPLARRVAEHAVARGFDRVVAEELRPFFYLPFEHSEDSDDQARAIELCESMGDPEYVKWALLHADIIARFGRFPHRNACLGRATTAAEAAFLESGGFAG